MTGASDRLIYIFAICITIQVMAQANQAASAPAIVDRYVSPKGSDANDGSACHPWLTLQHAAAVAKAGMTIYVASGTYNVSTITTGASGTPTSRIRYISDQRWGAKIISSAADIWDTNGSYSDFIGFDLSATGTNTTHGFHNGGAYNRFLGNHVHDFAMVSGTCPSGGGITTGNYPNAPGNEITGNYIHNIGGPPGACNQFHGIYVATPDQTVKNNIVFNNAGKGIQLWGRPQNEVVANNTIFNNQDGIVVGGDSALNWTATGNLILNNITYGNVRYGFYESGSVSGNKFMNNLTYANPTGFYLINGTQTNTKTANPMFVNYTKTKSVMSEAAQVSSPKTACNKGEAKK